MGSLVYGPAHLEESMKLADRLAPSGNANMVRNGGPITAR